MSNLFIAFLETLLQTFKDIKSRKFAMTAGLVTFWSYVQWEHFTKAQTLDPWLTVCSLVLVIVYFIVNLYQKDATASDNTTPDGDEG